MRRSNVLLYRSTDPVKFATLFYGVLDSGEHRLRFSNAGHDRPFFFPRGGGPVRLVEGGMMLGALEESVYDDGSIPFGPGDLLVATSDGITEAMDDSSEDYGEMFGEERLLAFLRAHRDDPAERLIDGLFETVRAHAKTRAQSDDMTVVVVRRLA
jgi:sigma-B regulation protein RsbU (phosphoserine phosphatase)